MKITIAMTVLCFVLNVSFAQKIKSSDVPANLRVALQQKYNVSTAKWDKEGENYEASFKQKEKEMSVVLDATGAVLEVETAIRKEELPKGILDILKDDYSDFKVEETTKIVSNELVTYEVEVKKGEQSFDLIFDDHGKLIKKIEKEED